MKIDEAEFKKMRFNVRRVPKNKPVIFEFPELLVYKDVFLAPDLGGLDSDFVLRYLIYMHDTGSPFNSEPNLKKRKAAVMFELGKSPENYTSLDVDMLQWKNKGVNRRFVFLCLILNNEKYLVWKSAMEALIRYTEMTIDLPEDADERATKTVVDTEKGRQELIKLTQVQLETARTEFLRGEKSTEVNNELMTFTLLDTLGLEPERWVPQIEERGDAFPEAEV
jgi:hypothetical protein